MNRYAVIKVSGSRFAYVQDTVERKTVARYDILRSYGGIDGWSRASEYAGRLNASAERIMADSDTIEADLERSP